MSYPDDVMSMDEARRYARQSGLMDILDDTLAGALRPVHYNRGDLIIRSGDTVDAVLFVVAGRAKAYSTLDNGQSVLAAFYKPLDIIGEAELFSSAVYSLSVEAMGKAVCLRLGKDAILENAHRDHRLLAYICGRLGAKLNDRFRADSINLRYRVESRFAMYLLSSAEEGVCKDALVDIADFIGCSYRQLSRVLRDFRASGIVTGGRGRLKVADLAALTVLAGDLV